MNSTRHQLALVIGSGGVRSVAALGVADWLHTQGLQPDLIVGCSGGAMFGAALATGQGVAHAVRLATSLWTDELTRQHRWKAWLQLLMPRRFGFDADFGLRDDRAIVQRLGAAFGNTRIEDLPLPLRVTATCPHSGQRVVIDRGPVVDALRASIALPFLFAPGRVDGRPLVDGFVSDPLPVSAAADARAVLALGFRAPLPGRVDGPRRLLVRTLAAMTNNLMDAQLAGAHATGQRLLMLEPTLERRVGLFETRAMPALVAAGQDLAQRRQACIRALLDDVPATPPRHDARLALAA